MKIQNLSSINSMLHHFISELRDIHIQKDSMRFRRNVERIGEIMSYEISKTLSYKPIAITTPLGVKNSFIIDDEIVIISVLRAGLALHQGFLNYFDKSENGFIASYRKHVGDSHDFEIAIEYAAMPDLSGKTLILVDPMLATGQSLVDVCAKIIQSNKPKNIHLACAIATPVGIKNVQDNLPKDCTLWVADIDEGLNEKKYIIPGLGDAGDLAYGSKI
ncbi:MAG: uracil phosphoribosyltransferase [Leptospira sp.]|nr:uracil phosphoribosyltransferase [Leptospira sp.]